jgi:DNA repair exonuclease SbcCD ATPase subunit
MENELKARITADISNFTAGMAKVESNLARAEAIFSKSAKSVFQIENALSKLSKQYKEGSISEAQFTKQADELSKSLIAQRDNMAAASREVDRLKKSLAAQQIKPAVQEIKNLGTSVAQTGGQIRGANNVALEFNRIIQDAPFGIIGVGNNIQQLTANFSQLSKNAGGSVPAIKAAFSALFTGPNIALLAISALTTALTLYQMGAFKSKEETFSLSEELEKYRSKLDAVSRANIEGAASAEKETQSLALLRAQAENANIPLSDRIEAVKQLQKDYPEYLGNLTQEQILTGNVGSAYKDLTNQIIATAKARAASDAIAKNSLDVLSLENKQTEIQIQLKEKLSKLNELESRRTSDADEQSGLASRQLVLQSEINNLKEDEVEIVAQIAEINKTNDRLTSEITKNIEAGAKFTSQTNKGLKTQQEILKERVSNIFKETDFIKQGEMIGKAISDGIITKADGDKIKSIIASSLEKSENEELQIALQKTLEKDLNKALTNINVDKSFKQVKVKVDFQPEQVDADTQKVIESMSKTTKEIERLEFGFQRLIERNSLGILTQTAGAFGNEIAKSFETGNAVLDSFIRNLFRAIPQIISAYTKLSAARKAQATASLGANATEASGDAVVIGTKAAKALGPLGLALLPVFIAGALGIIASAFSKARSGGGSGGGGPAQSFGNLPGREFGGPVSKGQAYIVGEKRPEIFVPSTSGVIIPQMPKSGGVSTGSGGTMKIEVEVKGRIDNESIRLSNKRAGTRVRNT